MGFLFLHLNEGLVADRQKCFAYVHATLQANVPRMVQEGQPSPSFRGSGIAKQITSMAVRGVLPQPKLATKETVEMKKTLLSKGMLTELQKKIRCYLSLLIAVKEPIFQQDEKLISEPWFTYLEEPFENIAKGTAVFVRETNLSTHCFFILGEIVDTASKSQLISWQQPSADLFPLDRSVIGSIAKNLGIGLLRGIGSQFGALIIGEIFPSGTPSYFLEVYKVIEQIVNEQLTQLVIDEQNGEINGIKRWVTNHYTEMKESGKYSEQELTDMLTPQVDALAVNVLGVLMEERFKQTGLCVFMIGAGMHLALLQEHAYVDPKSSPQTSTFIEILKNNARDYVDHARKTTDGIISQREVMVIPMYKADIIGSGVVQHIVNWKDNFTGEWGRGWVYVSGMKGVDPGEEAEARRKRDEDKKRHIKQVTEDLVKEMGDPYATADDWNKLIGQPLPIKGIN